MKTVLYRRDLQESGVEEFYKDRIRCLEKHLKTLDWAINRKLSEGDVERAKELSVSRDSFRCELFMIRNML